MRQGRVTRRVKYGRVWGAKYNLLRNFRQASGQVRFARP